MLIRSSQVLAGLSTRLGARAVPEFETIEQYVHIGQAESTTETFESQISSNTLAAVICSSLIGHSPNEAPG